jgi:hypothetical protein
VRPEKRESGSLPDYPVVQEHSVIAATASTPRIPKYRKHKASGQAVVTLNGKEHYLGLHGTTASKQAYDRLIQEWLKRGRVVATSDSLFVCELILAYLRHCQEHYRKPDGSHSSELGLVRLAMRPLRELYGRTLCVEFGPLGLKATRDKMITGGLSRGVINAHVGRIKRMFRWAVENELAPANVYHGLQAVTGLQRGRSVARETACRARRSTAASRRARTTRSSIRSLAASA